MIDFFEFYKLLGFYRFFGDFYSFRNEAQIFEILKNLSEILPKLARPTLTLYCTPKILVDEEKRKEKKEEDKT